MDKLINIIYYTDYIIPIIINIIGIFIFAILVIIAIISNH